MSNNSGVRGIKELERFSVVRKTRSAIVYNGAVLGAYASITFGHPLTGSKGQPVDSMQLRKGWKKKALSKTQTLISVEGPAVKWAKQNETGVALPGGGPYVQRSKVGGRFSVQLTITGFPRIVQDVNAKLGVKR